MLHNRCLADDPFTLPGPEGPLPLVPPRLRAAGGAVRALLEARDLLVNLFRVLHGDAEGDALDVVGDETARVATVALAVASAVARRRVVAPDLVELATHTRERDRPCSFLLAVGALLGPFCPQEVAPGSWVLLLRIAIAPISTALIYCT